MKLSKIDSNELNNDLIKKIFFNIEKENYDYANYIIVYGCHIKQLLDERLAHALFITNNKKYNKIILTGGVGVNGDFNESKYMYEYLVSNGIDEKNIIIENQSTTTEENNINILNMMNFNDITDNTNVVLVTQEAHMLRIILHWKRIINNPKIKFYYDYVDDSSISYENVINNSNLIKVLQEQIDKTKRFIENGTYVDFEIPEISISKLN